MSLPKLITTLFVLLLLPAPTFAQGVKQMVNQDNLPVKYDMMQQRAASKEAAMQEKKETMRELMQTKRTAAKETFQAKRDAFKEKLQTIKDTNKQTMVQNIDTKMATMNQTHTDRFAGHLEKLEEILNKLTTRITELKSSGKDTEAAEAALAEAKTTLETAKTAVTTQAAKEYVATITSETTLRVNVGTTVSQLQADLRTTHKTVTAAKQALVTVAMEVKKLTGTPPETTPSPTSITP